MNKEEILVKQLKDSFPDMLDFENSWNDTKKFFIEQGRKEAIEDVLKLIKLCSLSELRSQLENYLKEN